MWRTGCGCLPMTLPNDIHLLCANIDNLHISWHFRRLFFFKKPSSYAQFASALSFDLSHLNVISSTSMVLGFLSILSNLFDVDESFTIDFLKFYLEQFLYFVTRMSISLERGGTWYGNRIFFFFGTISPTRRMTAERSLWISLVILFLYLHTLAWLLACVDPYLDRSITVFFFADSFLFFFFFLYLSLTRRWRANQYVTHALIAIYTDTNEGANCVWVSVF